MIYRIRLLPAWPKEWDVDFNLHAPGQNTVEGELDQGEFTEMIIMPESRRQDLIIYDGGRASKTFKNNEI
jgi:hypothetical protein